MRRLAPRWLSSWSVFARSTQSGSCACQNAAAPGFRSWLSTNAATSPAAAGGTGRAGAASESGGSPWSPLSAVMFIPSVVCGCLAYWQYERMKWKEELIRLRQGIAQAEARELFSRDKPLLEYDKVKVQGRFLHEYSLFVGPRPRSLPGSGIQPGYIVITPMISKDRKGVLLVNRGWVPTAWKEEAEAKAAAKLREAAATTPKEKSAATATATATTVATTTTRSWWSWLGSGGSNRSTQPSPTEPQPTPEVKVVPEPDVVVGVIQFDEQPSNFMPDNKPEADEFHFIQREAMTRVLGLPPDTPLVMAISTDPAAVQAVQKRSPLEEARSAAATAAAAANGIEIDDSGPTYPAPKHVSDLVRFSTMPGDHLNYALIWATLCISLALMARTAVTKPLRGPRIVEAPGTSARDAWKASQAN
ncbi:hypothetical protein Vretimale_15019 [Volvox reticuliferus]|uniref:SURF1-like protein n=1 Tax=Volvox reticuliferus TaxID=1737510 RepID=A0A8J4GPZ8_9CHLO|nr:hypothetical protein Vretifemale_16329 [Volvox reticuliferus]GIM11570.1 hypothetical protein Vretimale_15019 [Volvox reticuliferus]